AEKSVKKLIKKFPKIKIDFLILVTQTSPYRIPTAACILQEKLKLSKNIIALDINLGCSGFIYALGVATSFIKSKQAKNGLIVCADTYTKLISKNNAQCRPIFSDAAAATLISASKKNDIGPFELGTDGSGYNALELPQGKDEVVMNGSKVLTFAMNIVPENVKILLKKIRCKVINIDMFIFHQASQFILDNINRKLQIPKQKTFENLSKVGNTISASIPIALKDISKKIKNNNKIILAGYGVGLSWGSVLVKWRKIK
ncbi:ketoacyl-ACP synthase III, partial [Candidatus Pelagibacter bacterium]|nr:ketoacyl-ACP synthase III [Candidatus Pelagibacter bacterium]